MIQADITEIRQFNGLPRTRRMLSKSKMPRKLKLGFLEVSHRAAIPSLPPQLVLLTLVVVVEGLKHGQKLKSMMQCGSTHNVLRLDISPVLKQKIDDVDVTESCSEVQRCFLSVFKLADRGNVRVVFHKVLGDHDVPVHACEV